MRTGTLAFVAGAWLGLHAPGVPLALAWGGLALCVALALASRRGRLPAAFVGGALWTALASAHATLHLLPEAAQGQDLVVRGIVDGVPERRGGRLRFVLRVEPALDDAPGAAVLEGRRVRLAWYRTEHRPGAGERWRLRVRLRRPRGLANPHGFDYARWAARERIAAVGYVRDDPANARLRRASPWSVGALRERIARRVDAALGDAPMGGVVKALAVGLRGGIDERQWETLRRTGTAHLVAISGLHVGLVAWIAHAVAGFAWARLPGCPLRIPGPRVALIAAIVAAAGYAALAGFTIPTRRALLMLVVLGLARLRGRHVPASVVLAAACLAVVLVDPLSVGSGGFWLSFAAVATILAGTSGRLGERACRPAGRAWWRWGRVHLVVALGTAPATLALFAEAPLVAPLANAVAVPWVSLLVVPVVLGGVALVALVEPLGAAALTLATLALDLLWPTLSLLASLDTHLHAPALPVPLLAAGAVGCLLAVAPLPRSSRWIALCWLAPLVLWRPPAPAPGELEVTVLDVGQGLAVVLRTRAHTLVYDAGRRWSESFDAGRDVVGAHLRAVGVERVDRLVVSHGDADHAGGVRGLRGAIAVADVVSDATEVSAPRRRCEPGRAWRWEGIGFELLRARGSGSRNDRSCVLRVDAPGGVVLLPGDIERDAEAELLGALAVRAPVELLVAAHHGSRTSSTPDLVAALRPRHVAVSAGHRNRFGFPHPEVVARFEAQGAEVQDTARCGAIRYRLHRGAPTEARCTRAGAR